MKKTLWMPLAIVLLGPLAVVACTSSNPTTESTGQYVDSAAITTKVKTALLSNSGLKSFHISVTTFKDVVQLSGSVNSEAAKTRAGEIAAGTPGVRGVQNNLVVK